ncbi:hypothetical protein [Aliikangiella sp. IMCC44359]|uniref:hypothetical protein n=1 Tax=Aliikangiella sp. IMCC44359 TaxID=3459125 RepID=UPI00403AFF6A
MKFEKVLNAAIQQRPKYKQAVGFSKTNLVDNHIPEPLSFIYSVAEGTIKAISDESLMDIIPGFRLIHKNELEGEMKKFEKAYSHLSVHLPFLADNSSCYFSLDSSDGSIYRVAPEYGQSQIALSMDDFWQTILCFYQEGVYFLDSEGYLDYNFEKEGEVGARINPTCEYWTE